MKIIFLLISICLIGLVLYLGYRLDRKEEQNKRKKKYDIDNLNTNKTSKTPKNEGTFQSFKRNIQEKVDDAKEKIEEKRILKAEKRIQQLNEKREREYRIHEDIIDEESSWESLDEEFLIEKRLKDLKNEDVENVIIPREKNIEDETMPINTLRRTNKEKNGQNTVVINPIKEKDLENIQKKMLDSFKENEIDNDEDELLLDIEREIEQANIKRFTRVKKENVKKKKTTSKKEPKENKPKEKASNVKRFTRTKKDGKEKTKKKSK